MNDLRAVPFPSDNIPIAELKTLQEKIYGIGNTSTAIQHEYLCGSILILQDIHPVAIAFLYQNPYVDEGKTLLFGNLEFTNDTTAFDMLLHQITDYAKTLHFTSITGPINGSTWNDYRLSISHFGRQFLTDLPQPEYYPQHLLRSGFIITHHYFTYQSFIEPKISAPGLLQKVEEAGILMRPISLENYDAELGKLYPFCNTAFSRNTLFSPVSREDFLQKYRLVEPLIHPDYTWLAEDASGNLLAFVLCLPDTIQKERLVMKTIARNTVNRQSAGLVKLLADGIYNRAYAAGFRYMLHAFMHSSNQSKVLSEKYEGQVLKAYALFTKKVLP